MTTINDAFINALLTDSSYVDNLSSTPTGTPLAAKLTGRMKTGYPIDALGAFGAESVVVIVSRNSILHPERSAA